MAAHLASGAQVKTPHSLCSPCRVVLSLLCTSVLGPSSEGETNAGLPNGLIIGLAWPPLAPAAAFKPCPAEGIARLPFA